MTAQMVLRARSHPRRESRVRHRNGTRSRERDSADHCGYLAYLRRFDRSIIPAVLPATAR